MAREALYPVEEDEEEDYYTLSNPLLIGDRFAPGSEGSIAFDEPSAGGVRYPIASPATGGQAGTFGDVTPEWQRMVDEVSSKNRENRLGQYQDPQYNAELARAERNEISDVGSDPMAVQQAIRLQGLREMERLMRDGASQSEAVRLAGPKLYFNHPAAMASAMNHSLEAQNQIRIMPVPGGHAIINPNGNVQSVIRDRPQRDLVKELDTTEAKERVSQAMRDFSLARKSSMGGLIPPDPAAVEAARRELEAARLGRRNLIRGTQTPPPAESKKLTKEIAADLLKQAKGDKELARKLARDAGFTF